MDEWDEAMQARNRERMIEVLGKVGLASQASSIVDNVLANPWRYKPLHQRR